ncbi:MAG TPA: UDP-N-acetylglucosamine--N-acetylmuramyl-(pentapeptide) pyrophosphoryl-undecaprenol N-acetylglucosamine transferase [Candidatus Saccharibacteria bacterium]|nr:UDP-N-acetylglucosamine--N-acetylmuramyl-(pentapeptide) pyrophosphoryl-undecaprenol N-acetylglucosamine transferase [Candidatus Saccharibacteria bacterium]HMR38045.1 UDP-N-acetylglucosamine--N-acetylmuramyl-(pentapeptide) pyrophosphoryl-undecaprenol N-acetylglucosamine transferase [Candidatus Saccharibacteria bacterium]
MTPVAAVLAEVKARNSNGVEIRFWCDQKFGPQARTIMHDFDSTMRVDTIVSGKLRRYHSLPVWRQLMRPFTIVVPNIIDAGKVVVGIVMSLGKLIVWRPDVIFLKGGFVCLPIGFAAHVLRIPFVIHDSDAHPGLTNRVLSKWAKRIATGAPLEYYNYPSQITKYTGIPVDSSLQPPTPEGQHRLKSTLGFNAGKSLVVVTGGGLGAQRINEAIEGSRTLLQPIATVVLICGKDNYAALREHIGEDTEDFRLFAFISGNMKEYLAAADIVVARAGATTMLELASLGKPSILVPSIYLTGGHQVKNAKVYEDAGAAKVVDEQQFAKNPHHLAEEIIALLHDEDERNALSRAIQQFAKPHAASDIVDMLHEAANDKQYLIQ